MAKFTYNSLVSKYNNFSVPCIDIKINGKKVKTLLATDNKKDSSLDVGYIQVNASMDRSSMAQIKIFDVYSYKNSSMDEVATIGATIDVLLGYGSTSEQVFHGYIARLDYEFRSGINITITALDAISLMEQESSPMYYISKSYSDIITEILNKYSSLIEKKTLDSMSDVKDLLYREEKVSDISFINRLCNEYGKFFYISNGEAVITDKFASSPVVNLDIHETIRSVKFSKSYQHAKVKVIGFDPEKHDTAVTGESEFKVSGYKDATSAPQTKVIIKPNISTSQDATQLAKSITKNYGDSINFGTIECVGIPDITVGSTVTVSGVDKSTFDKYTFNVVGVTHTIDSMGFNTKISIRGWC